MAEFSISGNEKKPVSIAVEQTLSLPSFSFFFLFLFIHLIILGPSPLPFFSDVLPPFRLFLCFSCFLFTLKKFLYPVFNHFMQARLSVTPLRTGHLKITGIKYSLSSVTLSGPVDYIDPKSATTANHPAVSAVSLLGRLDIGICGPRLNSNKLERSSVMYGEDNRLNIMVAKPMPRLGVCYKLS